MIRIIQKYIIQRVLIETVHYKHRQSNNDSLSQLIKLMQIATNYYQEEIKERVLLENSLRYLSSLLKQCKNIVLLLVNSNQIFIEDLTNKIHDITSKMMEFVAIFEKQLRKITEKMNNISNQSKKYSSSYQFDFSAKQIDKFLIVEQKVKTLEENLHKTRINESKLMQTLNLLLKKYEGIQIDKRNKNRDEESTVQNVSFIPSNLQKKQFVNFTSCGNGNQEKVSSSKHKIEQKTLTNDKPFNIYYSKQSHLDPTQNSPHMRMFSQETKLSLRKIAPKKENQKREHSRINQISKEKRQGSLQVDFSRQISGSDHSHRLKFMINKLGQ